MAGHLLRNAFSQIQNHFLKPSVATISSTSHLRNAGSSLSSFTVDFLVNSCGLPLKSAVSVSNKFQLDERKLQRPQSVLQFLKSHHFSDSQVANLIIKYPTILRLSVGNNLQPKFEYYLENGFVGKLLPQLIVSIPNAIRRSLDAKIKPCVEFLRSFLDCNKKISTAILRSQWLFAVDLNEVVRSNVDFLMKEGIPSHGIGKILLFPRLISQKPETMICAVNALKSLGLEPNAPMFVHALKVIMSYRPSSWEKKVGFMKSIGWNEEEIFKAFKRFPYYFGYSEVKIRNALHFYLNIMRLEPQTVIVNPVLLGFSIEERIFPRYIVLNVLESKKLIERKVKPLMISEKDFKKMYIDQYIPEVPGLLEMYLGSKESKKIGT